MSNARMIVYQFIVDFIEKHKYPPAVREIAEGTGKSISVTHGLLAGLKSAGRIDWVEGQPRTITILDRPEKGVTIIKTKKGVPTVIAVFGQVYILRPKDQYRCQKS